MTREEKEQVGKYVLQMARFLADGCYQQEILLKAVHIIDEALEQQDTLDKIRAEIVDLGQRTMNDNRASGVWACRDIIDKYKIESEEI